MLDILKSIILGIVEGITEFLPISSTGHLILVNQFISFDENFTKKFDVIIQLGAILSVIIIFYKRLFNLNPPTPFHIKGALRNVFKSESFDLWKKVIIAVIPALFFGALLHDKIEKFLFNPITVSIALTIGGIILIILEKIKKHEKISSFKSINYKIAFFIGLIQCLALIPGTSRSAATIIGAMLFGCSRTLAVEFSFFLAIPTMIAATTFSLFKIGFQMTSHEAFILLIGFLVSFFTAWIVIKIFLNFISKKDFKTFGYYRIILGIIVLFYFFSDFFLKFF
jgi:undecaprenyl-diphosphatase